MELRITTMCTRSASNIYNALTCRLRVLGTAPSFCSKWYVRLTRDTTQILSPCNAHVAFLTPVAAEAVFDLPVSQSIFSSIPNYEHHVVVNAFAWAINDTTLII